MTDKDDGGPFHPSDHGEWAERGASFRDVAAMHAMAGMLACPESVWKKWPDDLVDEAVRCADALIERLRK